MASFYPKYANDEDNQRLLVEFEVKTKEQREAEERYLRFRRQMLMARLGGIPVMLAERIASSMWPDLDPLAYKMKP